FSQSWVMSYWLVNGASIALCTRVDRYNGVDWVWNGTITASFMICTSASWMNLAASLSLAAASALSMSALTLSLLYELQSVEPGPYWRPSNSGSTLARALLPNQSGTQPGSEMSHVPALAAVGSDRYLPS